VTRQAIGTPVTDVAVVVGKTARRKPVHLAPGPTVVERRRGSVALNAHSRLVTHAARLGIEGRCWSVPAQPPQRCMALGRMGAMAAGANRRGVAAGARTSFGSGLVLVPGQIGVRAQPDLIVVARFDSAACEEAAEIGRGVTIVALEPG